MTSSTHTRFAPADLEAQLERILSQPKFRVAVQLSRFLRFVVEETLAGRQEQIKQYTIAVDALGRDPDFDPQINPVVRMQAGQLRRALHRYYETDGAEDPIRIEIPKGRYVPIFLPHPNKVYDLGSRTESAPSALAPEDLSLALPDGPSIAVLPFVLLGNDQEDAYFATGLTEEVIIALTRFPEFLVIGPLDRNSFYDPHEEIGQMGQQRQVRFVLDGTIRKRGQTFRLTAKLTDTIRRQHVWGEAFEHSLETTTMIQIEQEIVGQVVATIADAYGVIPRTLSKEVLDRRTDSLSEYEAILRFHHHIRVYTESSRVAVITALEQLLERDPNHALATAMLGDLMVSTYYLGHEDSLSVLDQGEQLIQHALALEPNCQAAHYTMALLHHLRFQRVLCLEEIEHTLRLNPNHALYVASVAVMLAMMGEWERGVKLTHQAMRFNPHHPGWYHFVPFWDAYRQGDYETAWIEAQRFNTPDFLWNPLIRAATLGQLGRRNQARHAVDELLVLVSDFECRGRSLMQRVVFLEDHVEMLAAGLRKAGLVLADS